MGKHKPTGHPSQYKARDRALSFLGCCSARTTPLCDSSGNNLNFARERIPKL
jgi:hypothetical protein